ncbi:hypothetical protein RE0356_20930 [Prescottella equi]|nr:hypothetical protein RE0356_20930 [Prescottella equi]
MTSNPLVAIKVPAVGSTGSYDSLDSDDPSEEPRELLDPRTLAGGAAPAVVANADRERTAVKTAAQSRRTVPPCSFFLSPIEIRQAGR